MAKRRQSQRVREAIAEIREKTGLRVLRPWMVRAVEEADAAERKIPRAFDWFAFIVALIEFIRQWFLRRKGTAGNKRIS